MWCAYRDISIPLKDFLSRFLPVWPFFLCVCVCVRSWKVAGTRRISTREFVVLVFATEARKGSRNPKKTRNIKKEVRELCLLPVSHYAPLSCVSIWLPELAPHVGRVWCLHACMFLWSVWLSMFVLCVCVPRVEPQPAGEEHIILSESPTATPLHSRLYLVFLSLCWWRTCQQFSDWCF